MSLSLSVLFLKSNAKTIAFIDRFINIKPAKNGSNAIERSGLNLPQGAKFHFRMVKFNIGQ